MLNKAKDHFIGPMPVDEFKDYIDLACHGAPPLQADFSHVPTTGIADEMCHNFLQAVEHYGLCPGLRMYIANVKEQWDDASPGPAMHAQGSQHKVNHMPDLCLAIAVEKGPRQSRKRAKTKRQHHVAPPELKNRVKCYEFGSSLLGIEVRPTIQADPFVDPGDSDYDAPLPPSTGPSTRRRTAEPFESETREGRAFRDSIISHAEAQFMRQPRVFFFQILIFGHMARFVRWDCGGAVVSARFDYTKEPNNLATFIWRFAHLTDDQRGLDTTACLASEPEKTLFKKAVVEFLTAMDAGTKDSQPVRMLPGAKLTLDPSESYPTWKIHVVDKYKKTSTKLIIQRPFGRFKFLFGRGTRPYIAYDLSSGRLVCLKDTWRMDLEKLHREYGMYCQLAARNVPHIPEIYYGGDVFNRKDTPQTTQSHVVGDRKADIDWRITSGHFHRHVHHRIVQDIAYPLESAINEREFIQVFHDAFSAISESYDIQFLHRDISSGNVMISADGGGVLIDWDHAGLSTAMEKGIGNWWFMSVRLLEDPKKVHDLTDDLESMYWTMVYCALKRFSSPGHKFPQKLFSEEIKDRAGGPRRGGNSKKQFLLTNCLDEWQFTSDAVQRLLQECKDAWRSYYLLKNPSQPLADGEVPPESVSNPGYWIEKCASALKRLDGKQDPLSTEKKRKLRHDQTSGNSSQPDVKELRRSKRLKLQVGHKQKLG